MKIFLVLVTMLISYGTSSNLNTVKQSTHISTYSKVFEIIEDALDYRDNVNFTPVFPEKDIKILGVSIYEVVLSTDTYEIEKMEVVKIKY